MKSLFILALCVLAGCASPRRVAGPNEVPVPLPPDAGFPGLPVDKGIDGDFYRIPLYDKDGNFSQWLIIPCYSNSLQLLGGQSWSVE